MSTTLLRLPNVIDQIGLKRATIYERIRAGLFTAPIKIGQVSLWPEHEVDTIAKAMIASKPKEELRALVHELTAARVA